MKCPRRHDIRLHETRAFSDLFQVKDGSFSWKATLKRSGYIERHVLDTRSTAGLRTIFHSTSDPPLDLFSAANADIQSSSADDAATSTSSSNTQLAKTCACKYLCSQAIQVRQIKRIHLCVRLLQLNFCIVAPKYGSGQPISAFNCMELYRFIVHCLQHYGVFARRSTKAFQAQQLFQFCPATQHVSNVHASMPNLF